jgi:hypothetical protein
MGRRKLYSSEEERKIQYKKYQETYYSKPGKKEQQYLSNKKTQSERYKRWSQKNKEKVRAKSALEKALRLQRLPKWADIDKIKEFYLNCPEGYHVDHVIPLRGKIVSGFHIIENLQYLPAVENIRKSNKFDG